MKGLYKIARQTVAQYAPEHLIVALDPVNFEKPYTEALEGVSTVMKSTPPALNGKKRLTQGYPAMTATIVNLPIPALTYANWFSYTRDFLSQNREIEWAIRITRRLFPTRSIRFVGDAGLDDQKVFHQVMAVKAQCIIRAYHNRTVEVYNERLDRWETELLEDLTPCVPLPVILLVEFTHARKVCQVTVQLGWLKLRLPDVPKPMWALVVHHPNENRNLVLLTNVPITSPADAQLVYDQWRHRPSIEHTYRFQQEAGLDVEDMRVQSLEAMRRLFVLVLLTALFVASVAATWPKPAVSWLRSDGAECAELQERAIALPKVLLQSRRLTDLEMLAVGAYSPLNGFMGRSDYLSVVNDMHLSNGLPWSIPITLPVSQEQAVMLKEGSQVALVDSREVVHAVMAVEEKYSYDKQLEASKVYRTIDEAHLGVRVVYQQGEILLGGPVCIIALLHQTFHRHRHTPGQSRRIFAERSWKRVVGFQTRNPVHRAHEYIQKCALEIVDGLYLHPLVGDTQDDDIPPDVRMRCYEVLLEQTCPHGNDQHVNIKWYESAPDVESRRDPISRVSAP